MVVKRRLGLLEVCILLASLRDDSGENSFCLRFCLIRELLRSGESTDIVSVWIRFLPSKNLKKKIERNKMIQSNF